MVPSIIKTKNVVVNSRVFQIEQKIKKIQAIVFLHTESQFIRIMVSINLGVPLTSQTAYSEHSSRSQRPEDGAHMLRRSAQPQWQRSRGMRSYARATHSSRLAHAPTIFCVISGSRGAHCSIRSFFDHADARFSRKITGFLDQQLNYVHRGFMPGPQYANS